MTKITSLQNPLVKLVRSLAERKGRKNEGLFAAEGHAMLERALQEAWTPAHVLATKPLTIWDDIEPVLVSDQVMAALSSQNNPHDVLAVFKTRFRPHATKEGLWLALEEIRDPGNLGTIIRTADAAGASGVILAGNCCDPYAPECVRASTGSIFALPLVRMGVEALLDFIVGWKGEVIGTAMAAKTDYRKPYREPALLVMGSESAGLSQALTRVCTDTVRIPMKQGVDSLNVATAAALMLYEIRRPALASAQ